MGGEGRVKQAESGGWVELAARGRRRRWVGGASGDGVEIESEWAEWQTGLAEHQAYAEIDPRPGKDDEYDCGRLHDPSFIGPAVKGGAPPRSDASSPESGAPIGPRPPHDPNTTAGSGLILHPARLYRTVELSRSKPRDMIRLALNSRAMLR